MEKELAKFNWFRIRQRFLKWFIYLSEDGKSFKYEIGPFDYQEVNSYAKALPSHIKDKDKDA